MSGLRRLKTLRNGPSAPFAGFATERLYSALRFASGPYAARSHLLPPPGEVAAASASRGWARDVLKRLRTQLLTFELQLQFFVDETRTPGEDGSLDWPESVAPFISVARLMLPPQDRPTHLPSRWRRRALTLDRIVRSPAAGRADVRSQGRLLREPARARCASQGRIGRRPWIPLAAPEGSAVTIVSENTRFQKYRPMRERPKARPQVPGVSISPGDLPNALLARPAEKIRHDRRARIAGMIKAR